MGHREQATSGGVVANGGHSEAETCSCGICWCDSDDYSEDDSSVEFYSLIAMICVGVGAILVLVGYIVPRDYEFDRTKPARQMEAIELYYGALSDRLDQTILAGLAFVTFGVFVMSVNISVAIWREVCMRPEDEPLLDTEMESLEGTVITNYGSSQQTTSTSSQ